MMPIFNRFVSCLDLSHVIKVLLRDVKRGQQFILPSSIGPLVSYDNKPIVAEITNHGLPRLTANVQHLGFKVPILPLLDVYIWPVWEALLVYAMAASLIHCCCVGLACGFYYYGVPRILHVKSLQEEESTNRLHLVFQSSSVNTFMALMRPYGVGVVSFKQLSHAIDGHIDVNIKQTYDAFLQDFLSNIVEHVFKGKPIAYRYHMNNHQDIIYHASVTLYPISSASQQEYFLNRYIQSDDVVIDSRCCMAHFFMNDIVAKYRMFYFKTPQSKSACTITPNRIVFDKPVYLWPSLPKLKFEWLVTRIASLPILFIMWMLRMVCRFLLFAKINHIDLVQHEQGVVTPCLNLRLFGLIPYRLKLAQISYLDYIASQSSHYKNDISSIFEKNTFSGINLLHKLLIKDLGICVQVQCKSTTRA